MNPTAQQRVAAEVVASVVREARDRTGASPRGELETVEAFQAMVPGLDVDALYGPNTARAVAWATGEDAPPHHPALQTAVTWLPPMRVEAPAPTPDPSTTPDGDSGAGLGLLLLLAVPVVAMALKRRRRGT